MIPFLSRITIYPVKSLDGIDLQKAVIGEGGCFLHDREYAISNEEGNFIIGKSNSLVHSLRSLVDFEKETISFRPVSETAWRHFHLQKERVAIQSFLSDYFGVKTLLLQNKTGRFLDIPAGTVRLSLSKIATKIAARWVYIIQKGKF